MPEDEDLALITEAALAAGEIAARHFRSDIETWDKGGGQGPVSEADLEIDAFLRSMLLERRPDYGWLSEETEDEPTRLSRRRVFIVDPIDGTRAFIAGQPTFSHSIAIAEEGEVVAGVVHLPMKSRTFAATRGGGATLNGAAIAPSSRVEVEGARVLCTSASMAPPLWRDDTPPVVDRHFRSSLAYRLCLVAQGRFDAMLTLRDAWEWDVAAGDLIAREAGALVETARHQRARYNNPRPLLPGMVAAGPGLMPGLMARL
ncbi:3'(2'),5'-bisphosphate nucleotidase CysQ [Paroceanicella profunda]|uniref:3'(2'),5'-bisphosphate nucleotidase CysQ n=1 Tax=Paroceanicella profunda TaxID=2579971 RepID=A0A5B8FXW7_9RHOB|nr:3'(2'),5'-bisphosphate nucleotidase CysQ [Paroceanicella profunda]QDL90933.1 3'(2'),5'-bisphosphate nucleotidase CysQ [Paroceanicella profunda]